MRNISFQKSTILLFVIVALFLAAAVTGIVVLRGESLSMQLRTDRPVNILVIFEQDGKPASTQLLMFYASKSKAALLDVPANTAVILKTIKRMDRIDFIYREGQPKNYITEISNYLDVPVHGYLLFTEERLARMIDLLDGLQLFIPAMIIQDGPEGVRLPGGAVTLDGEKVRQYLMYRDENEDESDVLVRRQKLFVALIKKIAEKASYFRDKKLSAVFVEELQSNFTPEARKLLMREISTLDADTILLQKITGMYRNVEGQSLFFPFYDGELARDMLKQTLNAMSISSTAASAGRIFTLEIQNGTDERGLAARTAEIFESFGYEVVAVGNSITLDQKVTTIIDRYGDKEALATLASVIKCDNFAEAAEYRGSIKADFTIVLGKDFNGRICVK